MSEFATRLRETVRVEAEARARGKLGWLFRAKARPREPVLFAEGKRPGRFTRAAVMTAVSEAADRFSEQERFEFDHDGSIPPWFWPWVEERARWWDDNTM